MNDHKIIFFGPVGAGKSTAIRSVSDIDCINTDVNTSDSTSKRKQTTTVAMDYGYFTSVSNQRIHLYGTPGQERFRFMWEMITTDLAADSCGLILLLDNSRNYPRQDLETYIQLFRGLDSSKQLIIAVTCSDLKASPVAADYQGWLIEMEIEAPVYFIDARDQQDVLFLVDELLNTPATSENSRLDHPPAVEEELAIEQIFQQPKSVVRFCKALLPDIQGLEGVGAIALITSGGHLEESTFTPAQINLLSRHISAITPHLSPDHQSNHIESSILASGKHHQLIVFFADRHALVIICSTKLSELNLRQQIENILQWNTLQA